MIKKIFYKYDLVVCGYENEKVTAKDIRTNKVLWYLNTYNSAAIHIIDMILINKYKILFLESRDHSEYWFCLYDINSAIVEEPFQLSFRHIYRLCGCPTLISYLPRLQILVFTVEPNTNDVWIADPHSFYQELLLAIQRPFIFAIINLIDKHIDHDDCKLNLFELVIHCFFKN